MAKKPIDVEALRHGAARRRNIPTAEFESLMRDEDKTPLRIAYARRNRDLDPQLVWRGKDVADWSDLVDAGTLMMVLPMLGIGIGLRSSPLISKRGEP